MGDNATQQSSSPEEEQDSQEILPDQYDGTIPSTIVRNFSSHYVKLNVGGCLYYTAKSTLVKLDNMLSAMFSGRMDLETDPEGWVLIDRCGKHFGTILNYLRDGTVALPESARELAELYCEAKYYLISELMELCENALNRHANPDAICKVIFITSEKECQQLIQAHPKPAVKILMNRNNNKFSYTPTSDDNLLKNLEMFDRLSLRFSSRILFIKDVIGTNEICCWTFYGHGKKFAEICCTSIVYATDKKHTKVEFPENRIYEEFLNTLLYENPQQPDPELMQATSQRGAGLQRSTAAVSDDEEIESKQQTAQAEAASGPGPSRSSSSLTSLGRFRKSNTGTYSNNNV